MLLSETSSLPRCDAMSNSPVHWRWKHHNPSLRRAHPTTHCHNVEDSPYCC